jgi:hypothetical protein
MPPTIQFKFSFTISLARSLKIKIHKATILFVPLYAEERKIFGPKGQEVTGSRIFCMKMSFIIYTLHQTLL